MLSASAFVIMALSLTGVYVSQKNRASADDGYRIDLSALEGEQNPEDEASDDSRAGEDNDGMTQDGTASTDRIESDFTQNEQTDLDADPAFIEPPFANAQGGAAGEDPIAGIGEGLADGEDGTQAVDGTQAEDGAQAADGTDVIGSMTEETVGSNAVTPEMEEDTVTSDSLEFSTANTLQWPLVGNVLLNYSMDATIFFPTLEVYKYNPAIVIAATEGAPITAAANAVILDIYNDEEIGNAIVMNLGNGYELTYGQLDDIAVEVGDGVQQGDVIGYVAAPTKYYTVEGCNVYFKLTKDGTPVNPLSILE